jgi:hypothetical protein
MTALLQQRRALPARKLPQHLRVLRHFRGDEPQRHSAAKLGMRLVYQAMPSEPNLRRTL